jgi:periplasmic protein TonB
MTSGQRTLAPQDRAMFTHLLASKPPREGKAAAAATTASVLFHGALIAVAVLATYAGIQSATEEEKAEEVTFIKIEEQPPPPPPPPPEIKPPETKVEPKGFKTLAAPEVVPIEIPPPDTMATNEADFSGEGVEGGSAEGETPLEDQTFLQGQVSVLPKMTKIVKPMYPEFLKKMEIEGTVVIQAVIKPDGRVEEVNPPIKVIKKLHPQLDEAAVSALQKSEFSPALYGSRPVRVIMQIPYTFKFK